MLIYNLSLFLVFATFFQFMHSEFKTLHTLLDLGSLNFFTKILIIALFSMAGVPPFWGFFSKIFIFSLMCSSNFFILFPPFFFLIFIGLYFYIQNIRFLNSTAGSDFTPIVEMGVRSTPLYYYLAFLGSFLLTFGLFYTEDLIMFFSWVLL
jgi:NADH:ubiquinone oxidoreductase subunit 2 (subunit N)